MPAGYSGTPLVRKLGLKPGMRVRLLDAPEGYWKTVEERPGGPTVDTLPAGDDAADFTHLFSATADRLAELFATARAGMAEEGLVWASWPKKSSGVASEIGRSEVMAAGHAAGLVDIKVAAFDATWSGLKFVIPVADRRAQDRTAPSGRAD